MLRAITIAILGNLYFVLSLAIFLPFRMKPVENYNLFAFPVLAAVFLGLLYKACTVEKESKGYLYAYFAGIVMWQVVGEIPYIKVPAGKILQFSDLNIKMLGGYFYMLAGWVLLHILVRSGALKRQVAFCFAIFLGIWTFELYMDNYSFRVPLEIMPMVASIIMGVALIVSIVLTHYGQEGGNRRAQDRYRRYFIPDTFYYTDVIRAVEKTSRTSISNTKPRL